MKKKNPTRFVVDALGIITTLMAMTATGASAGAQYRLDDGEAVFFERQLESIESRLYETKYRELKYRRLIPVSNRDGAGASSIIYYMYTKIGMAKIIANPADDLPRSDVYAKEYIAKVYSMGTSFGFSTKEMRRAQRAGVPLEMMKVDAARKSIRFKESDICWNGEAEYNIVGLLDNTNIPNVQAPLNAGSTSREWKDKTPDEVIYDVGTLLVSGIREATNEVQSGDTLLLPIEQFNYIAQTPRSTHSDVTIMQFILNNESAFGIRQIEALPELQGTGTGATDQALLYEKDPEVLELRIPMEMQMLPPERRNLEMITNVESEIGGVVVRYPLACRKLYGI